MRAGGVDHGRVDIVKRRHRSVVVIEHDEACQFAGFQGPDLVFHVQRAGASHGGHFHHVYGGHHVAVVVNEFLHLRDITKLPDDIEGVAAHGAVRAEPYADAFLEHLYGGCDAFCRLNIGYNAT